MNKLAEKLLARKQAGNLRSLKPETDLIDFYSNDYLGLSLNTDLTKAIEMRFGKHSGKLNGSTGSRLLAGNLDFFSELENKLGHIFKGEKALVFNSGYNANTSVLSSIPQKGDTILYDELSHASLIDGARLSFAKRFSFRHNDLDDLERLLQKSEGDKYIAVEAVYSMDGDFAPLQKMVELAEKYNANLIVDEAHSTGVFGEAGNGLLCELGLQDRVFARIYTFGKAMGVHGACIVGSNLLIEYLVNFARPFIYTTALPLHSLLAIDEAFDYLSEHRETQIRLKENITFFKERVKLMDRLDVIDSESGVQAIKVAGNENAKNLALHLMKAGFDTRAILSPTVKAGEERLRICLHAYNTQEEIEGLVNCLALGSNFKKNV